MTKRQTISNNLYWVRDNVIANDFPDVSTALTEPDGLLAIGGDLTPSRLLDAYRRGIFPWFSHGQPLLWWSPNPRWILKPDQLKISRSLRKTLRKNQFKVTFDQAFEKVITSCAETRKDMAGTWITSEIKQNYQKLFTLGYAHSVECWHQDELAGGLYGVAIGKIFFGESMFSRKSDASKVALVHLVHLLNQLNFRIIDCQVHSHHLESLGAVPIAREIFTSLLNKYCLTRSKYHWPVKSDYS